MEVSCASGLGRFRREERAALAVAAEQAAFHLHAVDSSDEASDWLSNHDAHAALLESEQSESLAVEARSSARHVRLPMLALARSVSDLAFNDAFSWGADDVLPSARFGPLLTRLRSLPREPAEPTEDGGAANALVAEADRTRRTVVARVLRNAGLCRDLRRHQRRRGGVFGAPRLGPGRDHAELMPEARPVVERARAAGSSANFILCCAPRDLKSVREELDDLSGIAAVDGYAAPENVLFASNEPACRRRQQPQEPIVCCYWHHRCVPRRGTASAMIWALPTTYRPAVSTCERWQPPDDDVTWAELRPPRSDRLVRLVVKIAWRRRFNFNENATVPPGFGAQIIDGARADLDAWTDGCSAMSTMLG